MDGHAFSVALIDGIGQFAGTLVSPVALGGVVLAICLTRRPRTLRLVALALGTLLAAAPALATGHPIAGLLRILGAIAACLLHVEVYLGVVLPIWQGLVRLWRAVARFFGRRPAVPPDG